MRTGKLSDPAVRAFVDAVDCQDREGLTALPAPGATRADDGSDRDLAESIDREILSTHGHLAGDDEPAGGRALVARYRNDTWGEMRTRRRFTVEDDGRVSRFRPGRRSRVPRPCDTAAVPRPGARPRLLARPTPSPMPWNGCRLPLVMARGSSALQV